MRNYDSLVVGDVVTLPTTLSARYLLDSKLMPMYSFVCKTCEVRVERLVKVAARDAQKCGLEWAQAGTHPHLSTCEGHLIRDEIELTARTPDLWKVSR